MKDNLKQLLQLIKETPYLPVVPMVNGEVVYDADYGYWMGEFGRGAIQEFLLCGGMMVERDDTDIAEIFDILYRLNDAAVVDDMSDNQAKEAYAQLPWTKAIVLYIEEWDGGCIC